MSQESFEDRLKIPTSSTMLNCACSGYPDYAFLSGSMINLIGDSWAGKTLKALAILAECNLLPAFDNYRFIFDDVERANTFDMSYMFGKETADRIEAPSYITGEIAPIAYPEYSETMEDLHCNVLDALENERPCIYILDSFDALDAIQDRAKVEEMRTAKQKKTKAKGTYAMAKPKMASQLFRNITSVLDNTDSFLIIISQTRDDINPMSRTKTTRSGGRALKFYSAHEIWLSSIGREKSKGIDVGGDVLAKVTKAKLTGKIREAEFRIYYDMGVDDIRSCVDYLIYRDVWEQTKNTINASHFKVKGNMTTIIKAIEKRNLESKLKKIVGRTWKKTEDSVRLNRKRKYK